MIRRFHRFNFKYGFKTLLGMIKGDTIYVTLFDFCVSLICRSFDELEAELLKGQKLQVHTLNLLYETLNELFDIS